MTFHIYFYILFSQSIFIVLYKTIQTDQDELRAPCILSILATPFLVLSQPCEVARNQIQSLWASLISLTLVIIMLLLSLH